MYCNHCKNPLDPNATFCAKCGTQTAAFNPNQNNQAPYGQPQYQQTPYGQYGQPPPPGVPPGYEQKSRLVAGLLQLFVPFGVGRFYLGFTGMGVAQLLVTIFTCGIGAIWEWIDGIMILCGSVKVDARGVPLKD